MKIVRSLPRFDVQQPGLTDCRTVDGSEVRTGRADCISDLQRLATAIAVANRCSVAGCNGAIIATAIEALLFPMATMLRSSIN